MVTSSPRQRETEMPFESMIAVGFVLLVFAVFATTLSSVWWYTMKAPKKP